MPAFRAALIGFFPLEELAAGRLSRSEQLTPPPPAPETTGTPLAAPHPGATSGKCNSTHPQLLTPYPHVSLFHDVVEVGSHGGRAKGRSCRLPASCPTWGKIQRGDLLFGSGRLAESRPAGQRASGGQPARVSALRRVHPGRGGRNHSAADPLEPGREREESTGEARFLDHTIPDTSVGGRKGGSLSQGGEVGCIWGNKQEAQTQFDCNFNIV